MSESTPPSRLSRPIASLMPIGQLSESPTVSRGPSADANLCDRCGAAMYRMHAVWRCPACGFKTDCCGW